MARTRSQLPTWFYRPMPASSRPRARAWWIANILGIVAGCAIGSGLAQAWESPMHVRFALMASIGVVAWVVAYGFVGAFTVLLRTRVGARRMLPDMTMDAESAIEHEAEQIRA